MADWQPDTPSSDYSAMLPYWQLVDDINGGAMAMRLGGERYLPKFPKETPSDYKRRLDLAPFTPVYKDAARNIFSKPFEREMALAEGSTTPALEELVENIDGRGNHLFVVARDIFRAGVEYGVDWIFVDFPVLPEGATLADERRMGARPVWHRIPARRMLAVYEAPVPGGTIIVHARIDETTIELVDGEEKTIKRVRVLERRQLGDGMYGRPEWSLWEQKEDAKGAVSWEVIASGVMTIDEIPLVDFTTADRIDGSWRLEPPLRDMANMQVTEYQLENQLYHLQEMTAYAMLAIIGDIANDTPLDVGPREVLIVPAGQDGGTTDIKWLEPSGSASESLRKDLEILREEMRRAGLRPMMPQTGGVTATAAAMAQATAHTVIKMWALGLKDALEQALAYTAQWMGDASEPEIIIHTDFSLETNSVDGMRVVMDMHKDELVSREAVIAEAKRRNILMAEYDEEEDLEKLLADADSGEDEIAALTPAINPALVPQPQPGEPAPTDIRDG